jgi:hypothetical protein
MKLFVALPRRLAVQRLLAFVPLRFFIPFVDAQMRNDTTT